MKMLKKSIGVVVFLLLAMCFLCLNASAATIVDSGTCGADGDNLTWTVNGENVLTISGTGKMKNYTGEGSAPWADYSIEKIIVEDNVTSIGEYAFSWFNSTAITEIELPESLTEIGMRAFCYNSIAHITIPSGITKIDEYCFYDSGLGAVEFPDTITEIGDGAFSLCFLSTVELPSSLKYLGNYAFSNCKSLERVTIPKEIVSIGEGAFRGCWELQEIVFAGNAPTFDGEYIFREVFATVYYPVNNPTWTEEVMQNYGDIGEITWVAYTPVEITAQPESIVVAEGEKATVTVGAAGEGLTYEWYYKNAGSTTFAKTSSFTGATYSVVMTEARNGRQVYCVITDKYGNSVQSETVTLTMQTPLKITTQPKTTYTKQGAVAKATIAAEGDGLTYQWYIKNSGGTKYSKSSLKTAAYSTKMSSSSKDRQIYCVVTDQYGNSVTSSTVTLRMAATITKQPTHASAAVGSVAKTAVTAVGDGLTYTWCLKNPGAAKFSKSSVTSATYSVKMSESNKGRQIYCVVKDKYGKTATSDTVTLGLPVEITTQPKTTYTKQGVVAKTTVKADGDGLTYTWYVKNSGASKYSKSSITSATYSVKMSSTSKDRLVYCVIKDKYGNSIKTNTVRLRMAATITTQPKSVTVAKGSTAKVSLTAVGDGLTYTWYYKNAGATKFTKTTAFTGNTYSVAMNAARDGRQIYCVVTDKYGKTAKSNTVTLNMK